MDDKLVLVTGAGSGLGAAMARRLAADGARVFVNDLSEEAAATVAADVGGEALVFDVVDAGAFDTAVDGIVSRHGRIDVVVNNAGIAPPRDNDRFARGLANAEARAAKRYDDIVPLAALSSISDAEWDRMIKVHLYGVFHGTRAAARHMQLARRGSIVNISSIMGLWPAAGSAHYAAAKAAIIALTKSAALELSGVGVRANAVCPGYIDTPLLAPFSRQQRDMILMRIGMNRMGTAEEIAELVRFLAGDESSYCNGDVFAASGAYQ